MVKETYLFWGAFSKKRSVLHFLKRGVAILIVRISVRVSRRRDPCLGRYHRGASFPRDADHATSTIAHRGASFPRDADHGTTRC